MRNPVQVQEWLFGWWLAFTVVSTLVIVQQFVEANNLRDDLCPLALAATTDTVAFMQQHKGCVEYVPERPVPTP